VYRLGKNRIYYQTGDFSSKIITCKFIFPDGEEGPIQSFESIAAGIYYLDYEFEVLGDYLGIFYENSALKATRTFKVGQRRYNTFYEGEPLF